MGALEYVIVQAGGMGTRLKGYTRNKPKAIVPIHNKPMVFHLFDKFHGCKFEIIGDYKVDVLRKYLDVFSKEDCILVDTGGKKGTCSGIKSALSHVPEGKRFMLIWCDLVLDPHLEIPDGDGNLIGLSEKFECRWSMKDGKLVEEPSSESGVAGVFVFNDKKALENIPEEGEFVRWLSNSGIELDSFYIGDSKEYGLEKLIPRIEGGKCRPFNEVKIKGDRLVKRGIDEQGIKLAKRERVWYKYVSQFDGVATPRIYNFEPLEMEMVNGKNIFVYDFDTEAKREVLGKMVGALKHLHAQASAPVDRVSMDMAYYDKTLDRINAVKDLIPHADQERIVINGRSCRNVFFHLDDLKKRIKGLTCDEFKLIHGDCTFSNMMLRNGKEPVFIDPRGYFGRTELFGDPAYDWAKMYYSLKGNYDKFNIRKFDLDIKDEVTLTIESNGWEDMEGEYLDLIKDEVSPEEIKLLHALIWLSLTTYAWEDYDSICGAFYNGLWYLEEVL
ncbi:MAG: NTP transferase domain-containing protein [Candidatus Methanomethylophilaceae archaeon]|nr:NTP transferase domain-containing protein [Candidatus Methanomethylophilaceae archaeon]